MQLILCTDPLLFQINHVTTHLIWNSIQPTPGGAKTLRKVVQLLFLGRSRRIPLFWTSPVSSSCSPENIPAYFIIYPTQTWAFCLGLGLSCRKSLSVILSDTSKVQHGGGNLLFCPCALFLKYSVRRQPEERGKKEKRD